MDLSRMSLSITKIIDKKYNEQISDECIDIIHIKSMCNLYKIKSDTTDSLGLSEINISSPEFDKFTNKINKKNSIEILQSEEFKKKYAFFIRILYACLKIEVDPFDTNDNIITLKNNYQLVKALENKKKQFISEHLDILNRQYKNPSQIMEDEYEIYLGTYIAKIKITDKIMMSIGKLIRSGIFGKSDNLLTLILPYFCLYTEFIEEYN